MKIVQHKQSIETGQKIAKEECTIVNKRITSSVNEPLYTGRKICDYPQKTKSVSTLFQTQNFKSFSIFKRLIQGEIQGTLGQLPKETQV